jgi:lipid-A-disaccharide synthase
MADVSVPDRARRTDSMSAGDLLVVAGEASGDQHGARMLRELKRLRPGLRAFGLGSFELRAEGVDLVADSREISVVGISEALGILPRAKEIQDLLVTACENVARRSPC